MSTLSRDNPHGGEKWLASLAPPQPCMYLIIRGQGELCSESSRVDTRQYWHTYLTCRYDLSFLPLLVLERYSLFLNLPSLHTFTMAPISALAPPTSQILYIAKRA